MGKRWDAFSNLLKRQKKEGLNAQEKWGVFTVANQTFVTLGYAKMLAIQIIENESIDIRERVATAYILFHLYRQYSRSWKNKQMRDRARACEGLMAEWRKDAQKLYYLEKTSGKRLINMHLDPLSEEYDVKVNGLIVPIPAFMAYVGDCGGDEDIVPQSVAMFQTMANMQPATTPPMRPIGPDSTDPRQSSSVGGPQG